MQPMQKNKLLFSSESKKRQGKVRIEKILQMVQKAYCP
jgi:hypothetical protein